MENYVTLFDSYFLPQGLSLYKSLVRWASDFTLWIVCVDEEVYNSLSMMSLKNVNLIRLADVETPELLTVKNERTRAEYCWTLTPFSPKFVFERAPDVERVTYLDADMCFFNKPDLVFDEFIKSNKSVLITEHAYAPEYDHSATNGVFCVQLMIFSRNSSEKVRKWWEDRCIEWCYARFEEGKFGDQKYLDVWPELFKEDVHVLQHKEAMLAPWNAARFPYSSAIFYHFHALRIINRKKINLGAYKIPKVVIENIYKPYLKYMDESMRDMEGCQINIRRQQKEPGMLATIKNFLLGIYMQRWQFNIRHILKI